MQKNKIQSFNFRRGLLASAVVAGMGVSSVQAFEVDTGNPDLVVRFDNTIKGTYAQRVQAANSKMANAWNYNDGNRNFSSGSPVSQRIDVLTEIDVIYKENMGFRVSGNTWYDAAYENVGNNNNVAPNRVLDTGTPTARTTNSGLTNYADRYYNGPSAEFLDYFVFGSTEVGESSLLSGKIGSTTSFWGETLFSTIHSIAYGQSGIDAGKAFAVPGTEAKELFIPREQIQASFVLNEEWSFAAQAFFGWDATRFPESGTYFGFNDGIQEGGDSMNLILAPAASLNPALPGFFYVNNQHNLTPDDTGDFGLAAKWAPEWLDGTAGFYYRNTSDILQTVMIDPVDAIPLASPIGTPLSAKSRFGTSGANVGNYSQVWQDDIDIYGFSLSKSIAGVSVGFDLNYRENMPLLSTTAVVIGGPLATPGAASIALGTPGFVSANYNKDDLAAKGKTIHAVLNGIMTFADSPIWDAASMASEFTASHVIDVTDNEQLYTGESWYRGIDKPTSVAYTFATNFTPTWYQVAPGVDLSLPLTINQGIGGESAVQGGGNRSVGAYSVGIGADVYTQYRFDLKYIENFGKFDTCKNAGGATGSGIQGDGATPGANGLYNCTPGQITSQGGLPSKVSDRGMVALTFKTTI